MEEQAEAQTKVLKGESPLAPGLPGDTLEGTSPNQDACPCLRPSKDFTSALHHAAYLG